MYLATVHVYKRKRSNNLDHLYHAGLEALVHMYMPSDPQIV